MQGRATPGISPRLTWRQHLKASLTLGGPLVLANLAQAALTATDVMLMGRLGPDALAAGALASALYHACMVFCMGLVSATLPLVSSALGRRKRPVREVRGHQRAQPGGQRMIEHGGHQDTEADGQRTAQPRGQQEGEELGLVADFGERDQRGRGDQCVHGKRQERAARGPES